MTGLDPACTASVLMDPREVGLFDAVHSGWFQDDLYPGFPVGPQDVVADIGCGRGANISYCARKGAEVIFTDVRTDKVSLLEDQLRGEGLRATGVVSDSSPVPLESGCATRVICTEVLEHVEDPADVLAELARIGAPGALYLISAPDERGEKLLGTIAPEGYFEAPNHVRVFGPEELQALVEGAGLTVLRRDLDNFFWTFNLATIWAAQAHETGERIVDETLLDGPFPEVSQRWARLWWELLHIPEFGPVRAALNSLAPKSQIILARKQQ